jgi:hypothetical protein
MSDRSSDLEEEKKPSGFFDLRPPAKTGVPFIFQQQGSVQKEISPPIASMSDL